MVNSCFILTAFLVVGTVVLAVPIVPEGIAGTGMPEGTVGFQPGSRDMKAGSSEPGLPGLPIRTGQHDDISRGPPSAEGRPGPQSSRSFQRRAPSGQEVTDFVQNCRLPESYRQIMDQYNRLMRIHDGSTEEENAARENSQSISAMYHLIKTYIEKDGPSGTSPDKLAKIRQDFEKGENLQQLVAFADS